MIIDAHTHLFPEIIRKNREAYFSDEPAFQKLYQSPKSQLIGPKELLTAMDADGVNRSVIFGFPWRNSTHYKPHNDYIIETVYKYPDRFIGLGCFEPSGKNAAMEAERCIAARLSGIGELAFYETGIDEPAMNGKSSSRDQSYISLACRQEYDRCLSQNTGTDLPVSRNTSTMRFMMRWRGYSFWPRLIIG